MEDMKFLGRSVAFMLMILAFMFLGAEAAPEVGFRFEILSKAALLSVAIIAYRVYRRLGGESMFE